MLNKISRAAGFTNTEMKAILFLLIVLLTGLFYKYFFLNDLVPLQKFDYSSQDSIFNSTASALTDRGNAEMNSKVDYKQEVLDFNKTETKGKKRIDLLKEKSININEAELNEFTLLPGIGETTAKNILLYRETNGRFKTTAGLMNVKGIGEKKYDKIKKFIFVE